MKNSLLPLVNSLPIIQHVLPWLRTSRAFNSELPFLHWMYSIAIDVASTSSLEKKKVSVFSRNTEKFVISILSVFSGFNFMVFMIYWKTYWYPYSVSVRQVLQRRAKVVRVSFPSVRYRQEQIKDVKCEYGCRLTLCCRKPFFSKQLEALGEASSAATEDMVDSMNSIRVDDNKWFD